MKIEIKRVTEKNVNELQRISRQTFRETFADSNSAEDMAKYLEESFAINKLIDEINNEGSEFYFALLSSDVIGYLKVNFGKSQTELQDNKGLEIERIYVLQQYHGLKVGQVLYERAISLAKDKNMDFIWLGVWEENPRAISFYKKNGFTEFDKHIFKLGTDEQTDIMMKKFLDR